MPPLATLALARGASAAATPVFGLPSPLLEGFYLAMSTLVAQCALTKFSWFSPGSASGVVAAPSLAVTVVLAVTPSWSRRSSRRYDTQACGLGGRLDRPASPLQGHCA